MQYTINELAKTADITTRALRYYDKIGLLKPMAKNSAGYRFYGETETDKLQQILFYKELGFELSEIERILNDKNFDSLKALEAHLSALCEKKQRIEGLIKNVRKTILKEKGETTMTDNEKFEAFKTNAVKNNEKLYGEEIRGKYGEDTVDASNKKMMSMDEETYAEYDKLTKNILETLEHAVKNNLSPNSETGKKVAAMHKQWLEYTWPSYSSKAHVALSDMYLADERFMFYYDAKVKGCAKFLNEAIKAAFN